MPNTTTAAGQKLVFRTRRYQPNRKDIRDMEVQPRDGKTTTIYTYNQPKFTETITISRTTRLENTLLLQTRSSTASTPQHHVSFNLYYVLIHMCAHSTTSHAQKIPLLLLCHLLVVFATVDSVLSSSHSLRCFAASVRAATAIWRKGWRQRHAPQPFNYAIQRAYTHVHLQHVFGSFAPITLFTTYEPKNPHQWLAKNDDTECHATTILVGRNLTRSERQNSELQHRPKCSTPQSHSLHRSTSTARGNSPLKTTQFLELEDTRTL